MRHSSPVAESRVKPAREGRIGLTDFACHSTELTRADEHLFQERIEQGVLCEAAIGFKSTTLTPSLLPLLNNTTSPSPLSCASKKEKEGNLTHFKVELLESYFKAVP
ncbi:hypothetical protein V6N13_034925 [Hibiscus sabdariffa]